MKKEYKKLVKLAILMIINALDNIYIPLNFHKLSTKFPLTFHQCLRAVLNEYAEIVRQ